MNSATLMIMPPRKRRPRGHVEQLPSGTFRAVAYAGVDPFTGKDRYLKRTAPTWDAAQVTLTRLMGEIHEERHPKSNISVGQVLDQWLDVATLAETTRDRYLDLIRLYIRPTFGDIPAAKLDAELLERYYARLQRCRELCSGQVRRGHTCRPLASATVRQIHQIIRTALERAVRWQHLGVNKATFAEAPSPSRPNPDPPSAEEASRILNAAWADPDWGMLLWLTMITGRRRGEVSALRWRCIDFERCQLIIAKSHVRVRGGVIEKDTKSGSQPRVALDPHTLSLLAEHRERVVSRCDALGIVLSDDAYVFSLSPDGSTFYKPSSISQRYRRLAKAQNLRSTRFHALRHYSATELIAAGVDVRTVAGRLGHSGGGSTTLRVYADWVSAADRQAAATMANIIPRPVVSAAGPRGPYETIAAELREQIESGVLAAGDHLPTVLDLAETYNVSAGTVNRAMALLRSAGLIDVSRGRRAVVAT
ncbi:MAG: integrase [Pseudonocardiales bacterium]|nr:integrase [Pseudonocardiales bacterium]